MNFEVDTNAGENEVFEQLTELHGSTNVQRKRLDIGDVRVTLSGGEELLFERKSWSDWVSSIRDGRYHEQKARLLARRDAAGANTTLFYVIETHALPEATGATAGFSNHQAYAGLLKTQLRDNINVVWAASAADVARHVFYIASNYETGGFKQRTNVAASGYAGVVHHTAKRKNTEGDQFAVMLSSMPGVSGRKAHVITEAYPTACALVKAYEALGSDKLKEGMLQDLKDGDKRLGPAISKRVKEAFC